jgi:signal transduction histidine kinase
MRLSLRGPPLGIKLLVLFAALLVVPYFSFRQVIEAEALLIQGQAEAQLLSARGIAALLNGRDDLLAPLAPATAGTQRVDVVPLDAPVTADGAAADWQQLALPALRAAPAPGRDGPVFDLRLGEHGGYLYGLLELPRDAVASASPAAAASVADGAAPRGQVIVQFALAGRDGVTRHYTLLAGADGALVPRPATALATGTGTTAVRDADLLEPAAASDAGGDPTTRMQAATASDADGRRIEFRLPLALLARQWLSISVADPAVVPALPTLLDLELFFVRSPGILNIVQGLVYTGARVLVVDAAGRTRADIGTYRGVGTWTAPPPAADLDRYLDFLLPLARSIVRALPRAHDDPAPAQSEAVVQHVVAAALEGRPLAQPRALADGAGILTAGHPVVSRDRVIGAVVLEQNTHEILALQRQALERTVALSMLSMLVVITAILLFSVRLAWRIRSLRRETSAAIDQHGRLRTGRLRAQIRAGDEIGDLARSVSGVLARLHQHTRFLENIPRTLRHELNNPLNVVSTSLQNLELQLPDLHGNAYLDAAKRGVLRIGGIIQRLADAASLEESLESEDLEPVDLQALVASYVANCRIGHPECTFTLHGDGTPATVLAADYRIEQMLDKIIDNAIDFHHPGTAIAVHVDVEREHVRLTVANRGPALPEDVADNVFDSMVSQRSPGDQRVHFGLGLFVVRTIALHHGGSVRAANLPDRSGVAVSVRLPLAGSERAGERRPRQRGAAANGDTMPGER